MQEDNMVPEEEAPGIPEPEGAEPEDSEPEAEGEEASNKPLSHDRKLSCQSCGAPLAYMEGESVITCPYCGTTTMLAGYDNIVKIDSHSMLPMEVNENDAIGTLFTWLSRGFHKSKSYVQLARISSITGLMLPYWIVKSSASTSWRGKKKRTRTVGTGDNKRTETTWEPVSGRFSEDFTWPEYAREDPNEFWGVENIKPGKKSLYPDWGKFWLRFGGTATSPNKNLLEGQKRFEIEEVKNAGMADNLVNGQITQERAEANARANIKDRQGKMAESKADVLSDVDTSVNVNKVDLVYVPLWELEYMLGGKTYRALVGGTRKEVLSAEYPVSKKAKIVIFDVFLGIPAAIAGVIGFSAEGSPWARVIMFGLAGIMVAYSLLRGLSGKN
jgi:LSD1 subclass zinc finger protein